MPRIDSTFAKVVLRDGRTFSPVVLHFKSPAEADIRIRNMDPEAVVAFDRRKHVPDPERQIYDREQNRWLNGATVEHEWVEVPASAIQAIEEAI